MARAREEVVTTTVCHTRKGEGEEGGKKNAPPFSLLTGTDRHMSARGAKGDIQVWMRAESRGEC